MTAAVIVGLGWLGLYCSAAAGAQGVSGFDISASAYLVFDTRTAVRKSSPNVVTL